jgi:hypothetical protein
LVAAAEGMAAAVRSDADAYAESRRREADEEAERRLREASEQADALLSERLARISELSDRILARGEAVLERIDETEKVKAQLESLSLALGETADRVARELGSTDVRSSPSPPPPPLAQVTSEEEEEHPMAEEVRPLRPPGEPSPRPLRPVQTPHDDAASRLDDARLVALQMAVAGRTRDEVGAHLRAAFDVGDPDPILDHVFVEGVPPSPPAGA